MGFVEIAPKSSNPLTVPDDRVFARASVHGKGRTRMVVLHIGRAVAAGLGWDGVARVAVAWGQGPDRGRLRLEPAAPGKRAWKLGRRREGTFTVHLSRHPDDFAWAPRPSEAVHHEVLTAARSGRKTLHLTLPRSWLAGRAAAA